METAALLVDHVLPPRLIRQQVLSFPYSLHFVLAHEPQVTGKVLAIVSRAITTSKELNALVGTISERVARYLERQGWLARHEQSDYLTLPLEEGDEDTLHQLQGHSITYLITMGPQAGHKVLTLRTIAARESAADSRNHDPHSGQNSRKSWKTANAPWQQKNLRQKTDRSPAAI